VGKRKEEGETFQFGKEKINSYLLEEKDLLAKVEKGKGGTHTYPYLPLSSDHGGGEKKRLFLIRPEKGREKKGKRLPPSFSFKQGRGTFSVSWKNKKKKETIGPLLDGTIS